MRRPRAYRSPFWEFSQTTTPLLERYGFEYTGDLMDTLLPDYHVVNERTTTMIILPGHLILDDSIGCRSKRRSQLIAACMWKH